MTVKEWYRVLVEKNVTKHEIDDAGRMELVPCKIEERYPLHDWSESYRLCRLQGLDPEIKSFLFKLVHQLLPSKERVHHLTPTSSPLCWCESGDLENYLHLFYFCRKNREAGEAVLTVAQGSLHDKKKQK